MPRHYFTQSMSLLGRIEAIDTAAASFILKCRSNDVFQIQVGVETYVTVLRNIDGLNRDRVPNPPGYDSRKATPSDKVAKYIRKDELVAVQGIYIEHDERKQFDAKTITLMHADQGQFLFEDTHWWLTQIARFADEWLDDLFDDRRTYEWDDFAKLYQTNLNILGLRTDDAIQECATLSRLIYGLSSAYLLTGSERYRLAARAGVKYQRETFRSLSHDGKYCFWMFGKRKRERGQHLIVASESADDRDTIPIYEQIYAIAGLCQYYRISQSWDVLEDIRRTVRIFQDFYRDHEQYGYGGTGGYFSHLDYATMRPDVESLGDNRLRKNWNSIGDHIPAYLINLILALDPLPHGDDHDAAQELLETCLEILKETSTLILEKFPDADSNFVNERFFADWKPDHDWRWQKNRAIVGHNLKIAWNITRVAHFWRTRAATLDKRVREDEKGVAEGLRKQADAMQALAVKIADDMAVHGVDQYRGGCFDAVERKPSQGWPIEFAWGNTKDFWQQEQAILAYLIVYGATQDDKYLGLAREMMAFWNLYFLDHDNRGVYFRVTDIGSPVIEGAYSQKAGHAIAGYHSFELNYLAHTYIRTYVRPKGQVNTPEKKAAFPIVDQNFCLFFYPDRDCPHTTLNVLPDFLPLDAVKIASIQVNGIHRSNFAPDKFQIELERDELGSQIVVEFCLKQP
ncbi:AGE family epimerase/isomerase [Bradyrhizobium sp. 177]|uniref:AGE family epimerase/isomerase n=1 Tax=Bradyrhizobium sp. 177 TaxID=2782647 RepID=UPI001FF70679|nr:AGE family epimerase/isomerase [Bradyrhizobium sp. 177]